MACMTVLRSGVFWNLEIRTLMAAIIALTRAAEDLYLTNAKYKVGCGVLLPILEPLQHLSHSMLDQVGMLLLRGFRRTRPSPYVSPAVCSLSLPRITT